MTTLFHGSYIEVKEPLTKAGRHNLDFGRGFYLTNLRSQAEKWAMIVGSRHNDNEEGVVNEYTFNDELLPKYKVLRFSEYNMKWLDFVVANRRGREAAAGYDAVEGGMANDQVIDTVEDYEQGRITAEQALDQLRYKKPNHQFCIRNQQMLDRCLEFKRSYTINDED